MFWAILSIVIVALIVLFVYGYLKVQRMNSMPAVKESDKIKTLNDKNFKHQIKNGVTLVDFWASWCMPCKMMAPVLNDVAEHPSLTGNVAKVDVEKNKGVASKYGIRSIPTMVLFKNGKEIERFVGIKTKDFLIKQMKSA